jgi:hypothetical protein
MDADQLICHLEQSKGSPELDAAMQAFLEPQIAENGWPASQCTTNLVEAISMVKRVYPGWSWRVAECSVSDDAWLMPDFNCPEHGARLRSQLCEATDWAGITDVDLRPSGRNAVALCISMLKAWKALHDGSHQAPEAATAEAGA